jgi:hypothetical protein
VQSQPLVFITIAFLILFKKIIVVMFIGPPPVKIAPEGIHTGAN